MVSYRLMCICIFVGTSSEPTTTFDDIEAYFVLLVTDTYSATVVVIAATCYEVRIIFSIVCSEMEFSFPISLLQVSYQW